MTDASPSGSAAHAQLAHPRTTFALWLVVLGPIAIWAARLWAGYALVPYSCAQGTLLPLQAVSVVALLLTAALGMVAWRYWQRAGGGQEMERDGLTTRARFMAVLGVLSSGFFLLVIVAESVANVVIDPCL